MNILIVTQEPFPIGQAATNRILSYSKTIVKLGHTVVVHCLRPTEVVSKGVLNNNMEGDYYGIKYVYTSGTTLWPGHGKHYLYKIYLKIRGYINSFTWVLHQRKHIDVIQLESNSFFCIWYYWLLANLCHIKYVQEKSEFPFVLRNKTTAGKIWASIYVSTVYKAFDGMIIETQTLMNYFKDKVRRGTQLLCVPMTVDFERFSMENVTRTKNIVYCGNMMELDGVSILIKAFAKIVGNHKEYKLVLIGKGKEDVYRSYRELVNSLNIDENVVFWGRIPSDKVPLYLCGASLLVLASPSSTRSQSSLPSKLGEYLATGVPVVITSVGEVPRYLTDNVSAYLAEPDSVDAFAAKMDYALSNLGEAINVGKRGKEVSQLYFGGEQQALRIVDFFKSLN
jgi:glycosyltransferase involved in cell wall biosynthesis